MRKMNIKSATLAAILSTMLVLTGSTDVKAMQSLELTVSIGDTKKLTVENSIKKVKWKSSNNQIVSVNSKGKITARQVGSVVIKAKIGKRVIEKYKIIVQCSEHNWVVDHVIDAAKDCIGYTEYVCSVCSATQKGEETYYQPTEEQVYNDIMAMQETYPDKTPWTNDNYYEGACGNGYGCAGFAYLLSDAGFGTLVPAVRHTDLEKLRVGDVIRINNDKHSVMVLAVDGDEITTAEGNVGRSIRWNMTRSKSKLKDDTKLYIITRWQDEDIISE